MARSCSWTTSWWRRHNRTRLDSRVGPPSIQCQMWCPSTHRVFVQPGKRHPPSRARNARRIARGIERVDRPTSSTCPSAPSIRVRVEQSHASRRATATGNGSPSSSAAPGGRVRAPGRGAARRRPRARSPGSAPRPAGSATRGSARNVSATRSRASASRTGRGRAHSSARVRDVDPGRVGVSAETSPGVSSAARRSRRNVVTDMLRRFRGNVVTAGRRRFRGNATSRRVARRVRVVGLVEGQVQRRLQRRGQGRVLVRGQHDHPLDQPVLPPAPPGPRRHQIIEAVRTHPATRASVAAVAVGSRTPAVPDSSSPSRSGWPATSR